MGLRFRKSKKVAPGIRLFFGKKGISTSFGRKGANINIGKRGTFLNIGMPGTGLSYRQRISTNSSKSCMQSDIHASESVIKPSSTQHRSFNINYWSLFKYIIGLIAIYFVYNWTKIYFSSDDWHSIFTVYYVIALIVIIFVFYRPAVTFAKRIFQRNRNIPTQDKTRAIMQTIVKESTKRNVSNILQDISNNDSDKVR